MGWVSWIVKDEVSESGCMPPLLASFVLRYSLETFIMASIMVTEFFDFVHVGQIIEKKRNLVPSVGLEPTTYRLQGGCSTS